MRVPRLEQIRDVDTLQQAALLLEKTVISQQTTIARLKAENARLRGETVPTQLELDLLKEQLDALRHKIFAPSSEKRPRSGDSSEPSSGEPRRGHGPKEQPLLPISTVTHTLPEGERTCPVYNGVRLALLRYGAPTVEPEPRIGPRMADRVWPPTPRRHPAVERQQAPARMVDGFAETAQKCAGGVGTGGLLPAGDPKNDVPHAARGCKKAGGEASIRPCLRQNNATTQA